jgi:hypothetical protein
MITAWWRIILKPILHKYGVSMWTELKCIRAGSNEASVNVTISIRVSRLRLIQYASRIFSHRTIQLFLAPKREVKR